MVRKAVLFAFVSLFVFSGAYAMNISSSEMDRFIKTTKALAPYFDALDDDDDGDDTLNDDTTGSEDADADDTPVEDADNDTEESAAPEAVKEATPADKPIQKPTPEPKVEATPQLKAKPAPEPAAKPEPKAAEPKKEEPKPAVDDTKLNTGSEVEWDIQKKTKTTKLPPPDTSQGSLF